MGRPPKGKAVILEVFEERYQGVTKFAPDQLATIANELIEGYAGGDKPTPKTVRNWISKRMKCRPAPFPP